MVGRQAQRFLPEFGAVRIAATGSDVTDQIQRAMALHGRDPLAVRIADAITTMGA